MWPSGDFTIGRVRLDRPESKQSVLGGITRDGVALYYEGRRLPTEAERLSDEYFRLEKIRELLESQIESGSYDSSNLSRWRAEVEDIFSECDRVVNQIAAIPDLPHGFADEFRDRHKDERHMGLSVVSNSRKPKISFRKPRGRGGLKGITPEAKRMVRSALKLMEDKYGRGNLSLFTGTLPSGLLPLELLMCSENASYISERYVEEIKRELARQGFETHDVVAVIEIQTKRYEKYGEICIHIHVVFPGRKNSKSPWFIPVEKNEDIFCRQIENLLGHSVDRRSMARLEKAKGRLGNEMGKYLSKADKASRAMIEKHPEFIPKSWVFMPQALRREVKAAIKIYQGSEVEVLRDGLKALEYAGILKSRPVCVELEGRQLTIGHVGYMRYGYSLEQFLCPTVAELCERISFLQKRHRSRDIRAA